MAEGLIYRPADPKLARELSVLSTEWLIANGDVDIVIMDVSSVCSNIRGYYFNVEFSSEAGEGMLEIENENGNWTVKEE